MALTLNKNPDSNQTQNVSITGQSGGGDPLTVEIDASQLPLQVDIAAQSQIPLKVEETPSFNLTDATVFYLIEEGGGSNTDMRGDYSGGKVEFAYTPTRDAVIKELHLNLGAFVNNEYGHSNWGSLDGLNVGIDIFYELNGRIVEINHVRNIHNTPDAMAQCSRWETFQFPRNTDEGQFWKFVFDFKHLSGGGIFLDSATTDKIYIELNDDFTDKDGTHGLFHMDASVISDRKAP